MKRDPKYLQYAAADVKNNSSVYFAAIAADATMWYCVANRLRLSQNGNKVGYVSACGYSPRFRKNIGVGMVSLVGLTTTSPIVMEASENLYNVDVVSLPFNWGGQITSRPAI